MPFSYSAHSTAQRATLHPDLQLICDTVLKFHDFKIQEGYRDKEAQNKAFALGNSKLKFPNSKHNTNPSFAMDLLPFINGAFIGWVNTKQWYFFAGRVLSVADMLLAEGKITHALCYGGDWDGDNDLSDNTITDLPHFELRAV